MSLLNSASLVVTPNAYKEGTLYSVIPNTTLGDMTVVRATTATRVNSAGLIELVPYNLLTYSEQLNNVIWEKSDTTITANSTTAPNGTLTADRMFETSTTALHGVYQEKTLITGTNYSISCYVKKGNRRYCGLQMFYNITRGSIAFFDLDNGTLVYEYAEGGYTITNSNITNVGNGWYRLEAIISVDLPTAYFGLVMASTQWTTGTAYDNLYLGDVTKYVDSWGFQLNDGSLKDYLRTETRLNIPRLDYSNGSCPSLLVEPQRTNLLTYSEQFDNAAWTTSNVTVTANTTISPDGTQNADTVVSTGVNSEHRVRANTSMAINTAYTVSIYAKKTDTRYAYIRDLTNNIAAIYDLQDGVVSLAAGTSTSITALGSFYRISMTFTTPSVITNNLIDIGLTIDPINFTSLVPINNTIVFWGAQLEQGSYPTSYIPTTTASVTRNADVISKTGISSLIGQTEGTVFGEFEVIPQKSESMLCLIRDLAGGLYNDFIYVAAAYGIPAVTVRQGNVTYVGINGVTTLSQGFHKFAFTYKQNDFAFYVDGVLIGTDTSGNVPTCNEIYLGQYLDGFDREVPKKSFVLFPTKLTGAECISLTT